MTVPDIRKTFEGTFLCGIEVKNQTQKKAIENRLEEKRKF
jgi:hypothetical protein